MAMRVLPSVPFLNPTGQERAEAISRLNLGFGGARADGAPGDEIADVLAGHHVEELGGGGHAGR
jgi:hypothetical protein